MPTISSLYVELSLRADSFNNAIKDAQKEVKELEKVVKPTLTALKDLGTAATVVGGAVVASFTAMVKSSADYGESLNKVSIQTGITTQSLSALKYMAEQEETSFDALTVGLKKMSVTAVQNAAAFDGIGVKVREANGGMRPMNDILLDAAKRFASMSDETQRTALEVEIFGRSGSDLNSLLLRLGKEGLGPAQEMTRKLGLEMSGNAAKASDDFNDSIKEVEDSLLGLSNAVTSALLPGLTSTTQSTRDAISAVKDFAKEHEGLTRAIALTGLGLTGAGGLLLGLAGIVTVYPKVVIGLEAIAGGLSNITLAAGATVAAFALLAYWYYKISEAETDIAKTHEQVATSQYKAVDQTLKNIKTLQALGIVIDQGSMSWAEYTNEINKAMIAHRDQLPKAAATQADFFAKSAKEIENEIKIEEKWRAAMAEIYREQVKNAADFVNKWLDGFDQTSREADKMTDSIQKQEVATSKLAQTSVDAAVVIAGAMVSAHDAWDQANEKTMTSGAKLFNEINGLRHTDMDENLEILTKVVTAEQKAADQTAKAWKNAIENLNTRLAQSFADMIVNAKFNFDSLVSIGKQTVSNLLSAFISGLISPLTNKLAGLGSSLASSLLGGGGSSTNALNAAGFTADAGTAGIGGLLGLSGVATLGIGAGVAAVAALAAHFIGKGRRTADEFVTQFQNPFGDILAGIVKTGSVSDLDQAVAQFNSTASQFASQGGTEAKVVAQAHNTLDPLEAQIRRDLVARQSVTNVTVNVQGNVMPGMTDQIVQGMLDALQTNQGGMVTALQDAIA